MLKVGDKAPDFALPSTTGAEVRLKDLRGKKVVLYFYPKDDTPGCTKEACSFQEDLSVIESKGAVVFGVSADSIESHRKFSGKYGLQFPLLSDESKSVIKAYGVWKKKSLYGRTFLGIVRTTFVIGKDGTIEYIFPKVKVDGHNREVMNVL